MTAKIELELKQPKGPLVGKSDVDLLVNGKTVCSGALGQKISIALEPGEYVVQTLLHGVLKRKSKPLNVNVAPSSTAKVVGRYSRLWGNIQLADGNA